MAEIRILKVREAEERRKNLIIAGFDPGKIWFLIKDCQTDPVPIWIQILINDMILIRTFKLVSD